MCVCVRLCGGACGPRGTSSTGSDQDPSADLAPFLLPCHRSSSTYHDHYSHRGLRPPYALANSGEAARLAQVPANDLHGHSLARSSRCLICNYVFLTITCSMLLSLRSPGRIRLRSERRRENFGRCEEAAAVLADFESVYMQEALSAYASHDDICSVVSAIPVLPGIQLEEVEDPQVAGLPFARRSRLHFASALARSAFQLIEQFDCASLQRAQDQPPSCVLLTRRRNSSSSWLLFRRLLQSLPLRCWIRPYLQKPSFLQQRLQNRPSSRTRRCRRRGTSRVVPSRVLPASSCSNH